MTKLNLTVAQRLRLCELLEVTPSRGLEALSALLRIYDAVRFDEAETAEIGIRLVDDGRGRPRYEWKGEVEKEVTLESGEAKWLQKVIESSELRLHDRWLIKVSEALSK